MHMLPAFFFKMIDREEQIHPQCTLVSGVRGAGVALAGVELGNGKPVCCIVPDEQMVQDLEQDLRLFACCPVIGFPGYEIPPYTPLSPDQRTTASRLSALYRLAENRDSFIMVISVETLLRRVVHRSQLMGSAELLMTGEEFDLEELRLKLAAIGYEQVSLVKTIGDFSVRGGILDIFPPAFILPDGQLQEGPVRLDFFGDAIESIRTFDPLSQRSQEDLDEIILLPVSDIILNSQDKHTLGNIRKQLLQKAEQFHWGAEKTAEINERIQNGQRFPGAEFFLPLFNTDTVEPISSVLDYLPEETLLLLLDPPAINRQAQIVHERIQANYHSALTTATPALPSDEIFIPLDLLHAQVAKRHRFEITDFIPEQDNTAVNFRSNNHLLLKQDISLRRKKEGLLPPLVEQIEAWLENGDTVILCCRSEKRRNTLSEMLQRYRLHPQVMEAPIAVDSLGDASRDGLLYLTDSPLSRGFSIAHRNLHLLSESELFGEMRLGKRKSSRKQTEKEVSFSELTEGDIVVHREHGLGIYRGLETIELQGVTNDFMHIEYREGDKLYLPVDRLNLISRYEGLSDKRPKIDKLGTQSWKATKKKVSEEVWKVAQELLEVYANRELRKGQAFSSPSDLYHELEESFPYDETPGQFRAINETIDDLTSDRPMDRLICGDVGYGKTEVAIRAAFKVIEDGFQVAVLVPTTVLAEQHAKTFQERLRGLPVTIECLNRFKSQSVQKRIVGEISSGSVDIIIGTHRLLSKDVVFKRLGLLIIDEEHRFGVAHKEKIKRLKAVVDILTLTATPIPRTLQMSLLGIRDLSVISSPPEHRRPVKTFVAKYDELVIKEAVNRELVRGGQVFVVHNRVKSIHRMAETIQNLVPEARIAVAHGQMVGKDLENIMVSFVNRDIDVLVSTTIIESGLDIPSANTIIINRADRLGLAEIYQLRGRVGRSSSQSFAYLMVPSLDHLSKDSRERLRALMEFNELGGGFKLAMSDLQIRGGGNLLGVSQSGHIAAIGYDLYLDLLQKTVADLKSRSSEDNRTHFEDELDPEINLRISAYIPDSYIADIGQRYLMYRRIAALSREEDNALTDIRDELTDRYGTIPAEVDNLFSIVALKKELVRLQVVKLEKGPSSAVLSFLPNTPVRPESLAAFLQNSGDRARLTPDGRLVMNVRDNKDVFSEIDDILTELSKLTNETSIA